MDSRVRVELMRKATYQDHVDVVLYALTRNGKAVEFVTWIHNKDHGPDATYNGHYYNQLSYALDDFNKRS